MKRILILCCAFLITLSAIAQRVEPDEIQTKNGALKIQPILHGTVVLVWNGKVIYVDPYGGAKAFEGIQPPDLILITDVHGDHLNPETLNAINTSRAIIIAPAAVQEKLSDELKSRTSALGNGASTQQLNIKIVAIPMYNLPEGEDSRHTKGRGNGYLLTMGGKNIYISGDTEDIAEMRALKNIDVAFLCMNQPYTMTVEQAASAVSEFRPKVVYPYHYRGSGGLSDVELFKKLVAEGTPKTEVRLRNWYPEY